MNTLNKAYDAIAQIAPTVWYYTRWTIVFIYALTAWDTLERILVGGGFWVMRGLNPDHLHGGALYLATSYDVFFTAIVVSAPYFLHYLLIRRPDVSMMLLRRMASSF